MNSQRVKGADVLLHEAIIKVDPGSAHEAIVNARKFKEQRWSENALCEINSANDGRRCRLSSAKQPLIDAILRIVEEQRPYWPLSVRQIHYRLLGADAPLIHVPRLRAQRVKRSSGERWSRTWSPVETRFHPQNTDLIYSRYRRRGDLSLDESFFGSSTRKRRQVRVAEGPTAAPVIRRLTDEPRRPPAV